MRKTIKSNKDNTIQWVKVGLSEAVVTNQICFMGSYISEAKNDEEAQLEFDKFCKIIDRMNFINSFIVPFSLTELESIAASLKIAENAMAFICKKNKEKSVCAESGFLEIKKLHHKILEQIKQMEFYSNLPNE